MRFRGRSPDIATEARFTESGGTIGRSSQCTLPLPDPERHISRIQAEINWEGGQFVLVGRGSTSCVQRNGENVVSGQAVPLQNGDELQIDDYVLRVEYPPATITAPRTVTHPFDPFADLVKTPTERAPASDHPSSPSGKHHSALIPEDFDPFSKSGLVPGPLNGSDDRPASPSQGVKPDENLDLLFGLGAQSADPLNNGGPADDPFGDPLSHPDTIGATDSFAARQSSLHDGAPIPDDAPEIHNPMHLPQAHAQGSNAFLSWQTQEGAGNSAIAGRTMPAAAVKRRSGNPHLPADALPGHSSPREPVRAPAQQQETVSQQGSLLAALLDGAGLRELPQDLGAGRQEPKRQLEEDTMRRLGTLLRLLSQGVIDLLATRSTLKSEMRSAMTVIAPQGNNPLKFSPDAATALSLLLAAHTPRGFMAPESAVQDAMNDLVAHQVGVIAGMRAALQGLLERFQPQALEARLTGKSVLDSMLPMNRKAKLWEQFENIFSEVSQEAEDDFETLFSREFVKAYEAQIKTLEQRDSMKKRGR
jgi:FHA domain-containing protein